MAQAVHILLIEDNEDHVQLVKKTLESEHVSNTLDAVSNSEDALAYLKRDGQFSTKSKPNVVLLDLNLPGMSGLDLLKVIKEDPDLATIPVVILTTSNAETDRIRAYQLRVNSYLTKPLNFDAFRRMVKDLGFYWTVWNQPAFKS